MTAKNALELSQLEIPKLLEAEYSKIKSSIDKAVKRGHKDVTIGLNAPSQEVLDRLTKEGYQLIVSGGSSFFPIRIYSISWENANRKTKKTHTPMKKEKIILSVLITAFLLSVAGNCGLLYLLHDTSKRVLRGYQRLEVCTNEKEDLRGKYDVALARIDSMEAELKACQRKKPDTVFTSKSYGNVGTVYIGGN